MVYFAAVIVKPVAAGSFFNQPRWYATNQNQERIQAHQIKRQQSRVSPNHCLVSKSKPSVTFCSAEVGDITAMDDGFVERRWFMITDGLSLQ